MARANRHFIPRHVWHITHRCHKREFLLKFAKDRHRWREWLYQAKKRYGLTILNYVVTSNHIHLLVYDGAGEEAIPKSVQLIAGRTAQEYNNRKNRKGAFGEDRYHATAIEKGEHLLRCIVYIDLNMVRAGVVSHPEEWIDGGYTEIQSPRRKNVLINYITLGDLAGFENYEAFQKAHREWVNSSLSDEEHGRQPNWTESIATGGDSYVETVQQQMGAMAIGRRIIKAAKGCELREQQLPYNTLFYAQKRNIDQNNLFQWNKNLEY